MARAAAGRERLGSGIRWAWYGLALFVIVFDQISKYWIQIHFFETERFNLLPILDVILVYNEGAAWSFLSDAGGWQRWLFTAISAVVSLVLIGWIHVADQSQKLLLWSLGFILGGAVGNLIDRVVQGKVTDFVLFYYESWSFPAFNVADSAITIGAILMLVDAFYSSENTGAARDGDHDNDKGEQ